MPIVVQPQDGEPLSQGDILQSVVFPTTTVDNQLSSDTGAKYVLVISRPCKAIRDDSVVVAPVNKSTMDLSTLIQKLEQQQAKAEEMSLDRLRRFLAGYRDGGQFTDAFYLGTLDTTPTRYAAELSSLATIAVPTDGVAREKWVQSHRVTRLAPDFLRDLHVRLFNTFARLGFDDYEWYSDIDLEVMITHGEKLLSQKRVALSVAEQNIQQKQAAGESVHPSLQKNLEKIRAEVETAKKELQPYLVEKGRRDAAPKPLGQQPTT